MKSIRGKLFLSVGALLLIVAALSYAIPKIFVERDINKASSLLSKKFSASAKKIQLAFTTMISGQFIGQATELEGLAKLLTEQESLLEEKKPLKERAAEIIGYAPALAYIQISDTKETVVIAPENGTLYVPSWAKIDTNTLAIRFPDGRLYTARLHPFEKEPNQAFYYLFPEQEPDWKALTFQPFDPSKPLLSPDDSTAQLFAYMSWSQNQMVDKAEMIELLAKKPEEAVGILSVNSTLKYGYGLLADEVFLSEPEIEKLPLPTIPYLLLRRSGENSYIDFVHYLFLADMKIILGYSISEVAKQVTEILRTPILLSTKDSDGIIFFPGGKEAIIPKGDFSLKASFLDFQDTSYELAPHQVGELAISILTPQDQATSVKKLMHQLRTGLVNKISFNLLSAAIVVFVFALLLLARISKKITRPITLLANASEEIGNGHYEKLSLPNIEKRDDEIAVLTHSFEGMVSALRDREKIRGALNKVVSKEVASQILSSDIELGGEERLITLLFSDIRDFTPLSNHFAPKELIGMLNRYMTHMCHIIDTTHGVVDKFVGDEIMALYGAPLDMEDHAEKALEAAQTMMHDLTGWNQKQLEQGKKPLEIGIGVHTGTVCAGNMGAENRLNYTVIGAHVNLASRMCAAAKPMQILVSKNTIDALKDPKMFTFNPVPPMKLKGFDTPVSLYELDLRT
ncbi:MAG: hypothetical protein S4CHLAM2_18520 [Chlamydiales bacterium]|nr:hypothetical protein [Chlamydiales bacterium]